MGILGQRDEHIAGKWFRFSTYQYSKTSETLVVDPTCASVARVFHLEGGTAPDAVVVATSALLSTITLGANTAGTFGRILVITLHGDSVGGVH